MFCNKCGNELSEDSYFCNRCGSPVTKPKDEPNDAIKIADTNTQNKFENVTDSKSEETVSTKVINEKSQEKNGLATASLVMGIIAIVFSFAPYVNSISFVLGVISIVFAVITISKKIKNGQAIAGLILSILALLTSYVIDVTTTKLIVRLGENLINDSPDYIEKFGIYDYFDDYLEDFFDEDEYDDEYYSYKTKPSKKTGYMTLEKFNKIELGMTYDEVVSIVGSEGKDLSITNSLSSDGTDKGPIKTYTWYGKDGISNAKITFRNDEVIGKTQVDLIK